jgi:ABC-type branched-subunit amino acid transport system substrate-binding protein
MWSNARQPSPQFFTDYPKHFDPTNQHPGQYGFSREPGDSVLSYDATTALLLGYAHASNQAGMQLQQALANLPPFQGASGAIIFNSQNPSAPQDKVVLLMYVDTCGSTHEVAIQGDLQPNNYITEGPGGPSYPVPPPPIVC